MATYGLVGGSKVDVAVRRLQKLDASLKITKSWRTISDLRNELNISSPAIIDDLKSIIVLDTGFSNGRDVDLMAEEFVILQDAFVSKGLRNVKLNLFTNIPDLRKKLEGSVKGIDGIYYENAEVYLYKKFNNQVMVDTFKGKYDYTSLYHENANKKDMLSTLEEQKRALVEDSKRISDDALNKGKDKPISVMNQSDYMDSEQTQQSLKNRDKAIRRTESQIKNIEKQIEKGVVPKVPNKKDTPRPAENEKEEPIIDPPTPARNIEPEVVEYTVDVEDMFSDTDYEVVDTAPIVRQTVDINVGSDNAIPTGAELAELFRRLEKPHNDTIEQKLKSDRAIVSIISPEGAGGSGFVAQAAEMYAMLGKRVLIIDLDIERRSQTLYYPSYMDAVKDHKGTANSLIRVTQVMEINNTVIVPVTSRIGMLSISRDIENIKDDFSSTISSNFQKIVASSQEQYDIVLIDLPLKYLKYYLRNLTAVDRNVFVIDNKFYNIEDFFSIKLHEILGDDDFFSIELLGKSSLVLNKYLPENRDLKGYQLSKYKVKEMLLAAGDPYDSITIAGEIPHYPKWEEQYYTGIRHIWKDSVMLSLYRNIFNRII